MRLKRFARIGDILPAVLKSAGLEQRLRDQEILSIWPDVVGEAIAARTTAVKMQNGTLHVQVAHSVWLQELYFMERDILRKLGDEAPHIPCRKIRFSVSDTRATRTI
jgi:predicted nucleic acid-binding Zn ribbon protein